MPELPEVETIVADLRPLLAGESIVRTRLAFPGIVRHPSPELFVAGTEGRRIRSLTRRGKYILAGFDADDLLVVHLGMTGRLGVASAAAPCALHTHAVFELAGGGELRYSDPRRFGRLLLGGAEELARLGKLPRLGPEPLDPAFTARDLGARLAGRRAPLKAVLLDQAVLAGVGSIYADEACFRAGVRPDRAAGRVGPRRVARLHGALRETLREAIGNRGSSVSDYVDGHGEPGTQQERLLVYGRAGRPCAACGRPLRSGRAGGRSTVYCSRCQR
ncbi:MAG: bifunctional DNA-formamidopyrimidine glycosylase/DNA-(apurinic or apyrimidinic site) lyase [Candidatus Dormibacterales bacterium]